MQQFDCIFVNGDSYSAVGRLNRVYGNFLSESLKVPVFNFSAAGSCNQRILRSSIEYLADLKKTYQRPLIIIGWSFIRRMEVWYHGSNPRLVNRVQDLHKFKNSRLITLDYLVEFGEATLEQKCLINEDLFIHKQLTDFYTNLYMFAQLLEGQGLPYLFFSAARNTDCPIHCFPYIESLQQVKWVTGNQHIYKLHDFCVMNWAKENDPDADPVTGHLSENGHQKFSNFILDEMLA